MGSVSTRPALVSPESAALNPSTTIPSTKEHRRQLLPHPVVELTNGRIEGFRHQLVNGRPISVFLGIPYAKPPVGDLRFRKPAELDAWRPSVLLAKRYRARSVQMAGFFLDVIEDHRVGTSEDCLYLNVIGPGWSKKQKGGGSAGYPVMLYIHGGAFLFDSAVKYHYKRIARTLVHHEVLVVTIQYRLGLFGYFSTGDQSCPGNFGLWDQCRALQWCKANIGAFGGDPDRITVFGQSAGAAATDLLSILPITRDLFSRAILMGGSAECVWAVSRTEQTVQFCRKWAIKLGFEPKKAVEAEWELAESQRMMDFLRALPARKFVVNPVSVLIGLLNCDHIGRLCFGPVVDGDLVPKSPKELRAEAVGRKVMIGVCKNEGMLFLSLAARRANAKLLGSFERQIRAACAETGRRKSGDAMDRPEMVRELYGINESMRDNKQAITRACVTLMSDFINNIAMHNWCDRAMRAADCTVYRYQFEHFNPDNTRALNPLMPFKSATHSTELAYVFDVNIFVLPWRRTKADKEVLAMVTKLWTNFAKYGDPNGDRGATSAQDGGQNENPSEDKSPIPLEWKPIDQRNLERHLCIASPEVRLAESTGPEGNRCARMASMYRTLVP